MDTLLMIHPVMMATVWEPLGGYRSCTSRGGTSNNPQKEVAIVLLDVIGQHWSLIIIDLADLCGEFLSSKKVSYHWSLINLNLADFSFTRQSMSWWHWFADFVAHKIDKLR